MKKTIKTAMAMLLALVMVCGSLTAFAATPGDIEWNFEPGMDNEVYAYAGELELGADGVDIEADEDNDFVYCTLETEADGYYLISGNNLDEFWFGIPEKFEDGVYYNMLDYAYTGNNYSDGIFYLEAGTHVVGFDLYGYTAENVKVEYLGSTVKIAYAEDALKGLVLHADIYECSEDLEEDYWLDIPLTLEFENGTDISNVLASLLVFTDEELTSGENEVEIGIYAFSYRQKATLGIVEVKDIITKIEIEELDAYTSLAYYFNSEYYNDSTGLEDMVITYADGTTEVIEDFADYTELENGLWVDTYYDINDEGDWCYVVSVAGYEYICEVCTYRDATLLENIVMYHAINSALIARTVRNTGIYFSDIFYAGSILGAFNNVGYFFSESSSEWLLALSEISRNTASLIDHSLF